MRVNPLRPVSGVLSVFPRDAFIVYAALADEADLTPVLDADATGVPRFTVPTDPLADPIALAGAFMARIRSDRVTVFLPGQRFDHAGARQGRGLGWYDRFLARCPRAWLRVGVLTPDRLSDENLIRQTLDEPVDWLLILRDDGFERHETHARF